MSKETNFPNFFSDSSQMIWWPKRDIEFTSSWVHEFTSSRVHEFKSSRVHEFTSSWVHEFTSLRVHDFASSRVHDFTSSWVHEFTSSWIHEFMSSSVHQFMSSWVWAQSYARKTRHSLESPSRVGFSATWYLALFSIQRRCTQLWRSCTSNSASLIS